MGTFWRGHTFGPKSPNPNHPKFSLFTLFQEIIFTFLVTLIITTSYRHKFVGELLIIQIIRDLILFAFFCTMKSKTRIVLSSIRWSQKSIYIISVFHIHLIIIIIFFFTVGKFIWVQFTKKIMFNGPGVAGAVL